MSEQQPPHSQEQRSLYRRHRPRTFADVVGQEPIVRTLRNAVERGKVHHAYLFVGSRGTGKTSMAKILAACLNCERGAGAGTVEPCGECESCVSIAQASSLDVIEMDAASNNSVDDIRDLRESVAYAPVSGRRKVYILDEAHMLSTAAWNAFLKTLEEPPPSTVFVLATTEAIKVPATVVDRCHRFDFQRPNVEQIANVIRRAAEADGISIPPEAVAALARAATGSFRDALGTLEQLTTYSGGEIALEDVLAVLGVADTRLVEEAVDAVAAGDARRALLAVEQSAEQGRDAASLASGLEIRARELLLVQALGAVPPELALTDTADAALLAQAERVDHATVVRLLELIGSAMEAVRAGADARTRLELALVKAARPEVDGSLRALLARLERLEQSAGGQPPAGSGGSAPQAQAAAAAPAPPEPAPAPPEPAAPAPAAEAPAAIAAAETTEPETPAVPEAPAEPAAPAASRPAARDLTSVLAVWPAVIELVRGENALIGALIAEARPVAVEGDDLILAFAASAQFLKKKAEDPANRMTVGEALHAVTGVRWRLSYELRETPDQGGDDGPAATTEEEWVKRIIDEFDAEEVVGWDDEANERAEADADAAAPRAMSNERGG